MIMLERLKTVDIERLVEMSSMRNKSERNNLIIPAILNEIEFIMRIKAITK